MDFLGWSEAVTRPITDEELMDVDAICARFSDANGYPIIPQDVWHRLNALHRQCHIRKRMAWHLYAHKAPFPLSPPSLLDANVHLRQTLAGNSTKPYRSVVRGGCPRR
jgi:hypothetical protein